MYDVAVPVLLSKQEHFTSMSALDNLHTTVAPVRAITIACNQGIRCVCHNGAFIT